MTRPLPLLRDWVARGRAGLWRDSVFNQLRVLLAMVFAGGSAIAFGGAWYFSNDAANGAYDQLLISAAVQIAETISVENGALTVSPPDAAFETLALAKDDRVFYAVRAPGGALLTGYEGLRQAAPKRASELPRLSDDRFLGIPVRSVSLARYISAPEARGWSVVTVSQSRQGRRALALKLMARMSSLILAVSVLGFWVSLSAARRALAPLSRIEAALEAREPHDVTPLAIDSPRETRALLRAINQSMARLADRMDRLQKFAAVAAHQIRTPLAAVAAQLEVLEHDDKTGAHTARIHRIRDRVNELGRFTHQLLGHAMISYRRDMAPRERFDVVPLARRALEDGAPLALGRDLTVSFKGPEGPVWLMGDPIILKEGLTNLVHNAALHGADTILELRVEECDGRCRITVFDDGPGIPEADWESVFQPFASRGPASRGDSAGLGLSIAREAAHSHNGVIRFRQGAPRGFEVELYLPVAGDPS
uniref:sensor histidine kinase n=1 Tax=uncultured Caulobacter sp. TaxID=158749 RepID=UPI0025CD557F|nr:sensor histidine kinase [uncultured Caulobacter sp.]